MRESLLDDGLGNGEGGAVVHGCGGELMRWDFCE